MLSCLRGPDVTDYSRIGGENRDCSGLDPADISPKPPDVGVNASTAFRNWIFAKRTGLDLNSAAIMSSKFSESYGKRRTTTSMHIN